MERGRPSQPRLSAANACLTGWLMRRSSRQDTARLSGFIHVGKPLSFVYDIADLYKTEISIPIAFELAANPPTEIELERAVRLACRDGLPTKFMQRIIPDIEEVLGGHSDPGAGPEYSGGQANRTMMEVKAECSQAG